MMKYTVRLTQITGTVDFAEQYLKGGIFAGTYTWFRMLGLLFCVLATLWTFGILDFGYIATIVGSIGQ